MNKVVELILEAYALALEELKVEFKKCVKDATEEMLKEKTNSSNKDWITLKEAQQLLPFKSKTTWQKLRDNGVIEISQSPGSRNILYSKKSIYNYINNNRVKF